jgi:hypothetical protein
VVASVRRLNGRVCDEEPSDTSRVPNFALADDSLPYEAVIPPLLGFTPTRPLRTGFCTVTLSAPQ